MVNLAPENEHSMVKQWTFGDDGFSLANVSGKQLDRMMVIFCTSGCASLSINFRKQCLSKGNIAIVWYDMICDVEMTSSTFSCMTVGFPPSVMDEIIFSVNSVSLWDYIFLNPILNIPSDYSQLLHAWFEQMNWGLKNCKDNFRNTFLNNALYNLFAVVDSVLEQKNIYLRNKARMNRGWIIANKFYALVGKYSKTNREVKFYADKLCITTDYLYKIANKSFQSTPKDIIEQQVVVDIKTLLKTTDLPVNQIAIKLHFEDPSYMCRFFRRLTGKSPMEFRHALKM